MEQGRLGSGVGVVLLLVLAGTLAVGADDLPVLIAPDVHLALPAAEGTGGELLDELFIVTAESLEDRYKGAEAGDHVGGSSPGSGNTGTMIRATFVELSRFNVSGRPMFCNGGRLRLPAAVAEGVG